MKLIKAMALSAAALLSLSASAKVTLPNYFTDNMVMQHDKQMSIPAKAAPGAKVNITPSWTGRTSSVRADRNGDFTFTIKAPQAGGPYSIIFDDGTVTEVNNILSGELWLCSGQSNMEFPVKGWGQVMNADAIIDTAQKPDIRLLQVKKTTSYTPMDDVEVNNGGWVECNSETVQNFSAIAYLFASEMCDSLRIPIGVIDTTWGGTPAEAWTGLDAISKIKGFEGEAAALKSCGTDPQKMVDDYERRNNEWIAMVTGKDLANFSLDRLNRGMGSIKLPAFIDRTEIPGFDGIFWLQREFNIDPSKANGTLKLSLGCIDDEDVVYLNGKEIARGSGYNVPRNYTFPASLLRTDRPNVISIRVTDTGGEGGVSGTPEDMYIADSRGNVIVPLAGDWGYKVIADLRELPAKPISIYGSSYPTVLYNAMLYPLRHLPVKGFLWYQGCANVGRAEQYAPLFKAMITNWRKDWGEELPFYFVQLAGWLAPSYCQPESEWAALRDAQLAALELPNTAFATAIDLGHPADIHPRDKQDVAHRLANIALNRDYGYTNLEYVAPVCIKSAVKGDKIVIRFDHPVKPRTAAILGFIIGDKDGNFHQATARMTDSRTIELSAPGIKHPKVAKYNWADYPNGNLYGENGLPVAPFKTK